MVYASVATSKFQTLHRSPRRDNALALHQNFAGLHDATAFDIEQSCRVQHDRVHGRGRALAGSGCKEPEDQK